MSTHTTEPEARAALVDVQRSISDRVGKGYVVVHEGEYLKDYYARLSLVPVDVTMVVVAAEELISQG